MSGEKQVSRFLERCDIAEPLGFTPNDVEMKI